MATCTCSFEELNKVLPGGGHGLGRLDGDRGGRSPAAVQDRHLTEAVTPAKQGDVVLAPLGGHYGYLHHSLGHEVQAVPRVILVEDDLAPLVAAATQPGGQELQLRRVDSREYAYPGEKLRLIPFHLQPPYRLGESPAYPSGQYQMDYTLHPRLPHPRRLCYWMEIYAPTYCSVVARGSTPDLAAWVSSSPPTRNTISAGSPTGGGGSHAGRDEGKVEVLTGLTARRWRGQYDLHPVGYGRLSRGSRRSRGGPGPGLAAGAVGLVVAAAGVGVDTVAAGP